MAAKKTTKKKTTTTPRKTADNTPARTDEEAVNKNIQEHAKTPSSGETGDTASTPNKDSRREVVVGRPIEIELLNSENPELQPAGWQIRKQTPDGARVVLNQDSAVAGVTSKDVNGTRVFTLKIAAKDWEGKLPPGSYAMTATFSCGASFQGMSLSLVVVDG